MQPTERTYQSQFAADPVANMLARHVAAAPIESKDKVRSELSGLCAAMMRDGVDPLRYDFTELALVAARSK